MSKKAIVHCRHKDAIRYPHNNARICILRTDPSLPTSDRDRVGTYFPTPPKDYPDRCCLCETSTLKVHALSLHISATFTRFLQMITLRLCLLQQTHQTEPSLICDFCPSDQRFAFHFLRIPPRDEHPCGSAMYFLVI